MARAAFTANVSTASRTVDTRVTTSGPTAEPFSGALWTAVDAAIAVLVADGASPTQAHVTTLNNAWTAFVAPTGVALVSFDDSKTTLQRQAAMAELTRLVLGR